LPTWGELLKEFGTLTESAQERPLEFAGQSPADVLRRKYLRELSRLTKRATIVYATSWMEPKGVPGDQLAIGIGDMQGFMEAVSDLEERELDLILHSPGGSAEAAESIVEYLRSRFDHIRVVIPVAAMSAATMVALAADEILMGAHSQLGPIDPQFTIFTPEGPRSAPAQAIKDQFEMAKQQCVTDPRNIAAWTPILRSYTPGLLAQCDHQEQLAKSVVARWLERYMFAGQEDPATRAEAAANWFADFTGFGSHSRRVSRDDARTQGINIIDLEADDALQDAILSVHHAVQHTFGMTGATKIIENHNGRAFIQVAQTIVVGPNPLQQPQQTPLGAPPAPRTPKRGKGRRKR
jgi:hypothetical protein